MRFSCHPIAHISSRRRGRNRQRQYICKRRYNDLSVRKYTKHEDERGRKSDGTKKNGKKERRGCAQYREERKKENSRLNIKLHFAIGSSRRRNAKIQHAEIPRSSQKREKPRENLIFPTLSFQRIALNKATFCSRPSCASYILRIQRNLVTIFFNILKSIENIIAHYFKIKKKTKYVQIKTLEVIAAQFPDEFVIGKLHLTEQRK